ncbi:hypothetical protein LT336_00539 [Spiroplasma sp. JKS002671]|uniref:B3/B4 domain-containing protein n=1 Tax=Spiroplasma attinicola TaxID=2904537 RepID=UPI002022A170|nr:B3/4 domain-containing protein [Spiroplasma sp. JKS002671]MCL8210795.1 hypothetical protein [Spiroplasma sp. JKS002671]
MKKFIIEKDFWDVFPEAKIGVVICYDINNSLLNQEKYQSMIDEAQKQAKKFLTKENFSDNQVIRIWRDAYQKFKTKKGARSSIEALLKRVNNDNKINSINPLVDIYNTISLTFGLPCGGEDFDKIVGNLKLTKANGDENFIVLGNNENSLPYSGEIIYKDDEGAVCRCWNWREAVRTMLTPATTNAFLCLELVNKAQEIEFNAALKSLTTMVQDNLGGKCSFEILDINKQEIKI